MGDCIAFLESLIPWIDKSHSCLICARIFHPVHKSQTYCSRACTVASTRKPNRSRPIEYIDCSVCRNKMPKRGRKMYCSSACVAAARETESRIYKFKRRLENAREVVCVCGVKFTALFGRFPACSANCRKVRANDRRHPAGNLRCIACGDSFVALKENAKFCSNMCSRWVNQHGYGHLCESAEGIAILQALRKSGRKLAAVHRVTGLLVRPSDRRAFEKARKDLNEIKSQLA